MHCLLIENKNLKVKIQPTLKTGLVDI